MKNAIFICMFAAVGLSCASPGAAQKGRTEEALRAIKTLAIGPYNATEGALAVYAQVSATLDTTIFNVLARSRRFQTIIPHDTMCSGIDVRDRNAPGEILGRAETRKADALLLCTLDILESSFRSMSLHDAAVTLVLVSTKDSTIILNVKFVTRAREEYFSLPEYTRVVHDAAEGAVGKVLNAWGGK
jgi:hypothetical protein